MPTGTFSSYDLTVGTKLDIEDMISLLDPHDVPLHGMFDYEGRTALSKGVATQKKHEWLDDTLQTPRDIQSGAAATTTQEFLTVTDRLRFTTDDVILTTAGEHVRVLGYGTTANTLLVDREWAGSGATITSGSVLVGVGTALPEGSDPHDGRFVDRQNRYNITQIFGPHKLKVSGTEQVLDKYGLRTTELDYQIAKKVKEVAVSIEQAILYGARVDDTGTERRTMGGMSYFITNVDSSTTDISEVALNTQLQGIYDRGGRAEWLVVGTTQKKKISAFTSGLTINVNQSDRTRGTIVDYYESDFATLAIQMNRWVRLSDAFLFDGDQPVDMVLNGRELQFERLAKTGDSEAGQVLTERTFKFRRATHAARFSALQV